MFEIEELKNIDDIRLACCYVLSLVDEKVPKDLFLECFTSVKVANFFFINEALDALISVSDIDCENDLIFANKKTKEAAFNLAINLSSSTKDKLARVILLIKSKLVSKREANCTISKKQSGYEVNFLILDKDITLLDLKLNMPDLSTATTVKEKFLHSPQNVYKILFAYLSSDKEMIESLFLD